MAQSDRVRGRWAELACRLALLLSGWRVLEYGYRSKRGTGVGEIDLIAMRGAEVYIGSHPDLANHDSRFDVMIVQPWRWPRRIADAWRP